MKISITNIALNLFFVFVLSPSILYAQIDIKSLNDSIILYKAAEPRKALDFGFSALNSFKNEDEISLDFVNTNYYLGEVYFYLEDYKTAFEYLSITHSTYLMSTTMFLHLFGSNI